MFNTEQELVELIIKRFHTKWIWIKKYSNENMEFLREVNLGYWIPDIVIVNKKWNFSSFREKTLSMFDVWILDIIKKEKTININELIDITKSSKKKLNNSLSLLINEKMISPQLMETYSFDKYEMFISESIAIEVKLKNWQRALHQAHRYKWFANESYVLLPESNIVPANNNIELFKRFNVWLLSFNNEWQIKSYFKPTKTMPISRQMQYFLNEQCCHKFNSYSL